MRARKTYATHFVRAGMSAEENKHARRVSSAVAARRRLRGQQACRREQADGMQAGGTQAGGMKADGMQAGGIASVLAHGRAR